MKRLQLIVLLVMVALAVASLVVVSSDPKPTTATAAAPAAPPAPLLVEPAGPPADAQVLVRPHAPVLGAANAPVTVVEVFDPSCEACRAIYPRVKEMLAAHPGKVRVVLRYAAFHQGSDIVIGILTMAKQQGRLEPVLDALMERQPEWAVHGAPKIDLAWKIAQGAGLDVSDNRQREALPAVGTTLKQDAADVNALQVERTPTFFVGGRPLPPVSAEELRAYVDRQVAQAQAPAPAPAASAR